MGLRAARGVMGSPPTPCLPNSSSHYQPLPHSPEQPSCPRASTPPDPHPAPRPPVPETGLRQPFYVVAPHLISTRECNTLFSSLAVTTRRTSPHLPSPDKVPGRLSHTLKPEKPMGGELLKEDHSPWPRAPSAWRAHTSGSPEVKDITGVCALCPSPGDWPQGSPPSAVLSPRSSRMSRRSPKLLPARNPAPL